MNELAYASVTEIGRLVRAREASPVEIVDYFLRRISDRNRSLNAFVFVETRLPLGMQVVGRRYADHDVLTASAIFEQLRPWYDTYKICGARPLGEGM